MRALRGDLPRLRGVLGAAVPLLTDAAGTVEAGPKRTIVYATLGRILALAATSREPSDHEAVGPALEPFLRLVAEPASEEDADLRGLAVEQLGDAPTRRSEAAGALVKELEREKDPEARAAVLGAVARLATHADEDPRLLEVLKPTVAALTTLLGSAKPEDRLAGVYALGHIGPDAKPAESALSRLADNDPRPNVRTAAEEAIKAVQGLAKMPAAPRSGGGAMDRLVQ
nr:HEAT repeat domain-containing protein [Paludisphaera mucosa]